MARSCVEQPSVLVISLVLLRRCDPLNVDPAQVEHLLRLETEPGSRKDRVNRVATAG